MLCIAFSSPKPGAIPRSKQLHERYHSGQPRKGRYAASPRSPGANRAACERTRERQRTREREAPAEQENVAMPARQEPRAPIYLGGGYLQIANAVTAR